MDMLFQVRIVAVVLVVSLFAWTKGWRGGALLLLNVVLGFVWVTQVVAPISVRWMAVLVELLALAGLILSTATPSTQATKAALTMAATTEAEPKGC